MLMVDTKEPFGPTSENPSILLASDRERQGSSLHKILREAGFHVDFAGDYADLDTHLNRQPFDMVLLEVTGAHAVEPAVETALRVKRANSGQFVGYLADSTLDASGLAGDGIFPRSAGKLPDALRRYFLEGDEQANRP
jgi:PleD family two-component response regulator